MVDAGGGLEDMVEVDEIEQDYIDEHSMPEIVAYGYMFDVNFIRKQPDEFADMLDVLASEDFPPRIEYEGLKKYREELHSRLVNFLISSETARHFQKHSRKLRWFCVFRSVLLDFEGFYKQKS